jgi:hypothetical protein
MAEVGRETPVPAPRRFPTVAVVGILLGAVLGLLVPHPYRWHGAAPPAVSVTGPAGPFVLSDWEYPQAKALSQLKGGSAEAKRSGHPDAGTFLPELYASSTPDGLEAVWSHYAKLAGIDPKEFKPGESSGKTEFAFAIGAGGPSASIGGAMYYTGDPTRPAVRSATIVAPRPGYTATVFITRARDEDRTHVTIVVEKKPAPPAP